MLTLVLNCRKTIVYGLNVLVGALETVHEFDGVQIVFANSRVAIEQGVRNAQADGHCVAVLWSFHSPQYEHIAAELNAVRANPVLANAIHIAGGAHATAEPLHTLRAGFDFVAVGEGERTIIGVVRALLHSGASRDVAITALRVVKGLAWLDGGQYASNGHGERIDLNAFPPFATKHGKFSPIEITRGCIYACQFCQTPFMFTARFRHRLVENVCAHVRDMKEQGRMNDFRFISPTCLSYGSEDETVRLDKVEELLSGVRKTIGERGRIYFGTFPSELRPEHVSAAALRVLKKYVANDNLIIGGQSGSQRMLDLSRRDHSVEAIVQAVRLTLEAGFRANVDFIFGLPGETPDDLAASLRLTEKLGDMGAKVHGHVFLPLPGTPYKDAAPGKISDSTILKLERLSSKGKVYGQWRGQMKVAEAIARVR